MPIRINLLAEAQALEDMRRRDPVKRAVWVGVFLVILVLAWGSSLQLKAIIARGELNRIEGQLGARTNEYAVVLENEQKLQDVTRRLSSLQSLAQNRLLYGTLLNALQQTIIDDVQLIRFRADQSYVATDAIKPKTNSNNRITPGKPATVTEKIVLMLDAQDASAGDQVNKYKENVADYGYFKSVLGTNDQVRLTSLSPPGFKDGRKFVQFTLECRYPEKTR